MNKSHSNALHMWHQSIILHHKMIKNSYFLLTRNVYTLMHMEIGMKSCTTSNAYPEACYFWPLMSCVCCSLSGAWHSHKHGLCGGSPSLWSVSHPFAAVRGLEESMGHQSDQYRGVSPPQTRTLSQGLCTQWHQCKNAKLLCL